MIYCDAAMHRWGKRSEHAELIMRESRSKTVVADEIKA